MLRGFRDNAQDSALPIRFAATVTDECDRPACLAAFRERMVSGPDDAYDEYAAMEAARMRAEAGWNY